MKDREKKRRKTLTPALSREEREQENKASSTPYLRLCEGPGRI